MTITHVMSDGSVRDSVEGVKIAFAKNKNVYNIIINSWRRNYEDKQKNKD